MQLWRAKSPVSRSHTRASNVHNFGITAAHMEEVSAEMVRDSSWAVEALLERLACS